MVEMGQVEFLSLRTKLCLWSNRKEAHMMDLGVGVWKSVINGDEVPDPLPVDLHGRILYDQNTKVVDALLARLIEFEFIKVMHCKYVKKI